MSASEEHSGDENDLNPEYVLVKPPAQLSPDFIQCHKQYGLAISNVTTGIEIPYEANYWDIEEMLRSFFPTLFDWFDTLPKVEGNPDTDLGDPADLPQWLLCTKLPGRSSGISIAAGVAFPTGSDIDFNVQTKRSGFRENILILSKYYITLFMVSSINVYNIHSATRTPISSELLKQWQKCVGKKVEKKKTTPYTSPSPYSDTDSDLPSITPLITYTTRSSTAAFPEGVANAVAGPSTIHHDDAEVIEIEGAYIHCCSGKLLNIKIPESDSAPSPSRRTASPTIDMIENINNSFSGSFYVDDSLKALNPWDASAVNEAWEF